MKLFITLLFLTAPFLSLGQELHSVFINYSINEGLPSSEIYDVIQDDKGFMWFATDKGISKYDGYDFINYTTLDGLTDNSVFKFYKDFENKIWCNGWVSELCYLQQGSIQKYKYNHILKDSLGNYFHELQIHYDKERTLHVIYDKGYCKVDSVGNFKWVIKKELEQNSPFNNCVSVIIEGKVYTFTGNKKELMYEVYRNDSIIYSTTINNPLRPKYSLLIDNRINILSEEKLFVFDFDQFKISRYNNRLISIKNIENDIYLGLYQKGAYLNGNYIDELNELSVTSFYKDKGNGTWFTTLENGIYYKPRTQVFEESKQSENCISIFKQNNKLFVAYDNGTIKEHKNLHLTFKENIYQHQLKNQTLRKVTVIDSTIFYLNEPNYGHGLNTNTTSNNFIYNKIVLKQKDTIYSIGFSSKISRYINHKLDSTYQLSINIRCAFLYYNNILIGGLNGLYLFNNGITTKVDSKENILDSRIELIKEINDALLLGTIGNGLIYYSKDSVYKFTTKDGLSSNIISSIYINKNDVWVATNNGVNYLKYNKGKLTLIRTFTNFNISEINDIYVENNSIYLATKEGFKIISQSDNISKYNTPINITTVKINGEIYNKNDTNTFVLAHNQNKISIQYSGINYNSRGKLMYKYRLKGLEEQWNYTNQRNINYTSLMPNDYLFEISVREENGNWSKVHSILSFKIKKAYWQTYWFYCIVAFIFILLIYTTIIIFRKKYNKEKLIAELEAQALMLQINPHFIFNALNSIRVYLFKNIESADNYIVNFSKLMRGVLNNSSKQFVTIQEEIELLKNYIELEQMRSDHIFDYNINIDQSVNQGLEIPSLVLQPIVENAIIHGLLPQNEGTLELNIFNTPNYIVCEIKDNGVGFDSKIKANSKGLNITKKRLKYISPKSIFEIRKKEIKGTIVILKFYLKKFL